MYCQQNEKQNCNTSIVNKSLKNMTKLQYLETMLTTHNYIHEEVTSRLKLRSACYLSV